MNCAHSLNEVLVNSYQGNQEIRIMFQVHSMARANLKKVNTS